MKVWASILFAFASSAAVSQSIPLQTFTQSGSGVSEGSTLRLRSTFGQPIASSGAAFLQSGFVPAALTFSNNGGPIINFSPPSDVVEKKDQDFNVKVTDLDGISLVALFYRPISKDQFNSVELTQVGATDQYKANVLAAWMDNMGVEFYIIATDKTSKETRSPITGYYRSYIDASAAFLPSEVYKIGYKKEQYKIITLPYTFNNGSPGAQFDELPQGETGYRLATYDNGAWKEYPNGITNLEQGRGYWFLTSSDKAINLSGAATPKNYRADLFDLALKPGWNQVGNPYTMPIAWEDARTLNSAVKLKTLKVFDGTYKDGNILNAFEGGFVYLDETSAQTIKIPFKSQTIEGGRIEEFSTDLSQEAWMLNFIVEQDQEENKLAAIGMHKNALTTNDYYDDFYPPHFSTYAEMKFEHAEHQLKFFAKDIVSNQNKYTWSFTIDANSTGPLLLKWNNQEFGDNAIELFLYDITNSRLVDMRSVNNYPVTKNASYKIYYGENIMGDLRPGVMAVGKAYPNPATTSQSSFIKLPFALPGTDDQYNVQVKFYDAKGQQVGQVVNKTLPSGFHEIEWKANNTVDQSSAPGLYIYRLTVIKNNNEFRFTGKILITN